MTPKDQKILKTIELLMMLSRSKQQFYHGLTEEEKVTLPISRQVLSDSALTVPELTNSLQNLSKRGYTRHVIFFDENLLSQAKQFIDSEQFPDAIEKISKELDNEETSEKLNKTIVEEFKKIKPPNINISLDDDKKELPKTTDLLKDGSGVLNRIGQGEIGFAILLPFRDINTLYEKMNRGMSFDDIQDDGFWYDKENFEFHIDGQIIKTSYQNKPNLIHPILSEFFSKPNTLKIEYEEMASFDIAKGNQAYCDAMRKFVEKHPKLKHIFSVRKYYTEFYPDKYEQIP